jgi:ribonuclease P protein component
MIPKKSRIPRGLFESPAYRVLKTPFFSLKIKPNGLKNNRIAVIIGKYIDKRAVRRNLWKRRAKAQLLKAPVAGNDFILTVYPKTKELTREEFSEEIKKTLKRI